MECFTVNFQKVTGPKSAMLLAYPKNTGKKFTKPDIYLDYTITLGNVTVLRLSRNMDFVTNF